MDTATPTAGRFAVTGMTCDGCRSKVEKTLASATGVRAAAVTLSPPEANLQLSGASLAELNRELAQAGNYRLLEDAPAVPTSESIEADDRSWLATYKPLLLVFAFILGMVVLVQYNAGSFSWMESMRLFMGGFFVAFSFFKFIDIRGFADAYRGYDIVAAPLPAYGFVYPFLELGLGLAYLTGWNPFVTNLATLVIMGVSLIGVVRSVVNKTEIRCACLGTGFNLPMSTVTIIEDGLMVIMAAAMLLFAGI